jgi:hypothetical protein
VIDLYEMLAKAAAQHKLMVDFHGANKPTGLERTYPNIVGIEGIRGMEFYPPYAQHEVVLPFTRMLAGMGDYTPTHFGALIADTTWAHQVANAVILQSPLLVYVAHPQHMLDNPSVDVLKSDPELLGRDRGAAGLRNPAGRGLRPAQRKHLVPGDHQRFHGAQRAHRSFIVSERAATARRPPRPVSRHAPP